MYALSANYGGLIARMLLRPIEDSSQNLFAALCHDRKDVQAAGEKEEKERFTRASSILRIILRFYAVVSMLAVSIGPIAAPLLLRLVAGARWSDSGAGEVLGVYCYYIPLLAINGVSEAFVAAAASAPELRRQSFWMGAFSIGFAASTWFFLSVLKTGAKGLVFANCVNMGLRIFFNLNFASRCFREHAVEFTIISLIPNAFTIAVTAVAVSVAMTASQRLTDYGLLGSLLAIGAFGGLHAALM
jgi:oligosaccharide translocation protein RFT1